MYAIRSYYDAAVAGQRDLESAAERCAGEAGDHRLAELFEPPQVALYRFQPFEHPGSVGRSYNFV